MCIHQPPSSPPPSPPFPDGTRTGPSVKSKGTRKGGELEEKQRLLPKGGERSDAPSSGGACVARGKSPGKQNPAAGRPPAKQQQDRVGRSRRQAANGGRRSKRMPVTDSKPPHAGGAEGPQPTLSRPVQQAVATSSSTAHPLWRAGPRQSRRSRVHLHLAGVESRVCRVKPAIVGTGRLADGPVCKGP